MVEKRNTFECMPKKIVQLCSFSAAYSTNQVKLSHDNDEMR